MPEDNRPLYAAINVKLAEIAGASKWRVILRHILPNVMNTTMVLASLTVGVVIIAEASLSFLGVGVPPPKPAWGLMLRGGAQDYAESAPWVAIFPGIAIFVTVLALNVIGDGLRDALDPRLRL